MTDTHQHICDEDMQESSTPASSPTPRKGKGKGKGKKKHISMHEGIGDWADCCSCEAEPYWREHAEEMGVDFNEYEEDEFESPAAGGPPLKQLEASPLGGGPGSSLQHTGRSD